MSGTAEARVIEFCVVVGYLTDELQFGFKQNMGCSGAILLLSQL